VSERRNRTLAKLARAAADPKLRDSFGASSHRYRLRPPRPERDVEVLEASHGIRLPESYRRFVLEIGDGGAGPGYGLRPLPRADSTSDRLSTPSPFVPGEWYGDDWWDDFSDRDDEPDPLQGTLTVVSHGCAGFTQLVVTGPGRGRLVNVDLDGEPAPYVLEDADFHTWYERWLDELLAGCSVTDFGRKLPGDEDTLLAVLTEDPSPRRRASAAYSLGCLPRLDVVTMRACRAAATDLDPAVRTAVLTVVRATARNAAEDAVRAEAIRALAAFGTPEATARARRQLADPDPEIVQESMRALAITGDLTVTDLTPMLTRPDPDTRATAVDHLARASGDVAGLLEPMLDDEDPRVRSQAVRTAERRDDRTLFRALRKRKAIETDEIVLADLDRVVRAWRGPLSMTDLG
jgi:hypothetical protein